MSAERVFAGTYITEVQVREKALAWVPEVMRFTSAAPEAGRPEIDAADAESVVKGEIHTPGKWPAYLPLTSTATCHPREAVLPLTPGGPFPFGNRAGGGR